MTQSDLRQVAILTGITGQDSAYLAQFLMEKGHAVHGIKHATSPFNTQPINPLYEDSSPEGNNGLSSTATLSIRKRQDMRRKPLTYISQEMSGNTGNFFHGFGYSCCRISDIE